MIEKHFTLDRTLPGPDHAASLEPGELSRLVASIRNVERALGSSIKVPAPEEMANRAVARRSVVAARPRKSGAARPTASTCSRKRPGTGVSPMDFWDLAGSAASRDYGVDDLIVP